MTCRVYAPNDLGRFSNTVRLFSPPCEWLIRSIPSELGALIAVRELKIQYHKSVKGAIPSELGRLQSLTYINLSDNSLSGSIPSEFCQLGCQKIYLTHNRLQGPIPTEFGKLGHMAILNADSNSLNGAIPTELGELQHLRQLRLAVNSLTGSLPFQIGNLKTVRQSLFLSWNSLEGSIPSEFCQLGCREISLFQNRLQGPIPTEFGKLEHMAILNAASNSLNGAIPTELGELEHLRQLRLSANSLTGSLPTQIGNLKAVSEYWLLLRNSLEGRIPSEIGKARTFENLAFSRNLMKGTLPRELFNLRHLIHFNIRRNSHSGSIPTEVAKLQSLITLSLSFNQFTNAIPSELGLIQIFLWLDHNRLQGNIPSELARNTDTDVWLARNDLTGSIPNLMFNASSFQYTVFMLQDNRLSGKIPAISVHRPIPYLVLHSNQLGGSIPQLTFSPVDTSVFTAHGNHFSCELPAFKLAWSGHLIEEDRVYENIPDLASFNYSSTLIGNSFRGPLPSWVPSNEDDPLLYKDPDKNHEITFLFIFGLLGLGVSLWSLSGKTTIRSALSSLRTESEYSRLVIWSISKISCLCVCVLWPAFVIGDGFYECAEFPANFSQIRHCDQVEYFVGACFAIYYVLVCEMRQRDAETPIERLTACSTSSGLNRVIVSCISSSWLCIVCVGWVFSMMVLSIPAVLFTLVSSLPKENTLVRVVGHIGIMLTHRLSTSLSSTVVLFILPQFSKLYGSCCCLNSIKLELWGRICCLCIIPVLVIVVMHENCLGKWRLMWSVCSFNEGQGRFDMYLGESDDDDFLLLTTSEMCEVPSLLRVARNSKCSRAIVSVMSRLLIQKSFFEIFVVPCVRSLSWRASVFQSNMKATWTSMILGWMSFAKGSTKQYELSLCSKSLEVSIIWGPFIPVLPPLRILACITNVIVEKLGRSYAKSSDIAGHTVQCSYVQLLEQIPVVSSFGFIFSFCLCLQVSWKCTAVLCTTSICVMSLRRKHSNVEALAQVNHARETEMAMIFS